MKNVFELQSKKDFKPYQVWILVCMFILFVTLPILLKISASCYPYYDLGIYSQALSLIRHGEINPWLTGRQIHIFSDHFDPTLWGAVPLASLIEPAFAGTIVESLAVMVATYPVYRLAKQGLLPHGNALLLTFVLLFHTCTLSALDWPFHPTTWAIAPAAFLATAMVLKKGREAFVAFVMLLCCKEEFIYVGPPLAAWFLYRKRPFPAVCIAALTGLWALWVFWGRVAFFGPTMAYTHQFLADLLDDPKAGIRSRLAAPNLLIDSAGYLALFLPLSLFAWRVRVAPSWAVLLLTVPLFGIRFVARAWGFHYNAVTLGFCVFAFLPVLLQHRLPRAHALALIVGIVATDLHLLNSLWGITFGSNEARFAYCPREPGRLLSLNRAYRLIRADSGPLLAEQNLLALIADRPDIYMFNGPQGFDRTYASVLFEKPPHGVAWQFSHADVARQIDAWRDQKDTVVVIDDAFVFYAKGSFRASAYTPSGKGHI